MRKNHTEIESSNIYSLSELYHEKSKLRDIDYGQFIWMTHVNTSYELRKIINSPCLEYKGFDQVQLSKDPFEDNDNAFKKTVLNRRSDRDFIDRPIGFNQLSAILHIGNGITHSVTYEDGITFNFRSAPSGGGLYPVEVFCVAQNVENLKAGLYAHAPAESALYNLSYQERDLLTEQMCKGMQTLKDSLTNSGAVIFLVAHMPRMKFKYKERAYRFALIECGHIAQNILLAAEHENIGAVPIGGFIDDAVNDFLCLDGLEQFALYGIILGSKAT